MFIKFKRDRRINFFLHVLFLILVTVVWNTRDMRILIAAESCSRTGFLFAPAFGAGTSPYSVAVADFNRDGKADLAVANNRSDDVSILYGIGDGTFQTPVNFAVGSGPRSIAIEDFNGDGIADLAVANAGIAFGGGEPGSVNGSVSILLGNGKGGFQPAVSYNAGSHPWSITVGDFNGDGKPDLAVADNGAFMSDPGGVLVLLGQGDGTFQFPKSYLAGTNPTALVAADFNGDGKPDVAIASADPGGLMILFGRGDGTFLPSVGYKAGFGFTHLVPGDFNADGRSDLALLNPLGEIAVLLGNGDGSFLTRGKFEAGGAQAQSVTVGDINGDRKSDLAVVNGDTVSVMLGEGDGTFHLLGNFVAGYFPTSLAIDDFNGDGLMDFVVANSGSNDISILLGNGDGTFRAARTYADIFSTPFVTGADFNGDGKADLALTNDFGGVDVLSGNGDGTFQAPVSYVTGTGPKAIAIADFNGDGRPDMAVANSGTGPFHYPPPGDLSVLMGNGDGTFQSALIYTAGTHPFSIAAADFNGDGFIDLVAANVTSNDLSILFGNGDGTFQPAINFPVGSQPFSMVAGDFNGDGRADVALLTAGSNAVAVLLGRGDGTFQSSISYSMDSSPSSLLATDFNGDGKLDLAVANGTTVSILVGKGDGTFQSPQNFSTNSLAVSLATGDFNSDGKLDLIVIGPAETFSVLFGKGDGAFQPAVSFRAFYGSQSVTVADFDRDGKADLAMGPAIFLNRCSSIANGYLPLCVPNSGVATVSTLGSGEQVRAGYAVANADIWSAISGLAVFSVTQNGVVVSEVGVPALPPMTAARIFIDYRTSAVLQLGPGIEGGLSINTGFAIVNRGDRSASIYYALRNIKGELLASGMSSLPVNAHRALFIDQLGDLAPGFNLPPDFATATQLGSLDIVSDQPLAVLGLRLTSNQRGETLITSTPVADVSRAPLTDRLFFPQFVDGGGYRTKLILLNTSNTVEKGTFQIFDDRGLPLVVTPVGGTSNSAFTYSLQPNGVLFFQADGSPQRVNAGWVKLVPDPGNFAPVGAGIFSFTQNGVLVTESGIPSAPMQDVARIYIDKSGGHNTGLAVANPGDSAMTINVTAFRTDGNTGVGASPTSVILEPNGHVARFVEEIISGLPDDFTGILYFYSWPSAPFAALTLRSLTNSRNDFLLTTFPVFNSDLPLGIPLVFPQIADGGGYRTQFIVLNGSSAVSTTLNFYNDDGLPLAAGKSAQPPKE
ncbi:MAG: VCBS repeat-containing protein [Acidobacteriia bacterium]|nr:VCBS repeat-containing protein [Terriglobia bacterium]